MSLKQTVGRAILRRLPLSPRVVDILRFETTAAVTTCLVQVHPKYRRARSRIRRQHDLRVNVGSGGTGLSGWINIDIRRTHHDQTIPWDIRKGLPFADGQVAMLMAEHVVEHMDFRSDVPRFLKDAHRVLRPGGWIRIVVPDAGRWLKAYADGGADQWQALGMDRLPDDMPTHMAMINHVFHQSGEHLFAYDWETMAYALRQAGFTRVEQRAYRETACDGLAVDQENHAPYSLYVEAEKSPA